MLWAMAMHRLAKSIYGDRKLDQKHLIPCFNINIWSMLKVYHIFKIYTPLVLFIDENYPYIVRQDDCLLITSIIVYDF